ncbi:sulfonate ABC transporter substrate-binding protein [Roseomonas sp. M0104]|uniref:Thiamine pyrimidine synthase n=1 Tax=Teichococcus coralli TaxID=2545983 RepID=A0A845BIF1_9PROT|nr:ABC transporter substrate-binding protein [Pseudoroseomonas coralli]MXP65854.1 sulfonate ABC transporter substrate-binding protein [Pseudoroseomonas coralli]
MHRRSLIAAAGLALPALRAARAQGATPLRFSLDWALQGNHAMFTIAAERGLFRDAGLAPRIDRGFGSGDTVVKVASGAYDLGYAEVSAAVKFNAENPERRVVCIYPVLDRTAAAVITVNGRGIAALKDVAGKRLGAPEGEASRVLFPTFARAAGIDTGSIQWTSMAANLRDTMLARGQVDAVTGFLFTTHFNLLAAGVKEDDILAWPYAENGLDLYGSGIIARADWLEKNPQAASGFVRGCVGGLKLLLAEPDAAMESVKAREPLFDVALEKRRWAMTRDRCILTPAVREHGTGHLDMARAETLVRANAEAYGLKNPPGAESLFTDRFLPPAAERRLA